MHVTTGATHSNLAMLRGKVVRTRVSIGCIVDVEIMMGLVLSIFLTLLFLQVIEVVSVEDHFLNLILG